MDRQLLSRALQPLLPELTRFARWLVGSVEVADELTHEVVVKALQHADSIQDPTRLKAWLFRTARNTHWDSRRSAAVHERFVVLSGGRAESGTLDPPIQALPDAVAKLDVERALMALPEEVRSIILLVDMWEFSYEEIATILDIPLNTVRSRVARGRAKLLAQLSADDGYRTARGRSA